MGDFAFDNKELLATPTNLSAIARSVASVWQQEALAKNARDIALLGKELCDRLAKVGEDLRKVGAGLNSAVTNFNAFTNSFNSRLVSTGRKFKELNKIGRAHVCTPVTNAHLVCRLLLEKKKTINKHTNHQLHA